MAGVSAGERTPLDYKSAGVDIDAGNRLVEIIKPLAAATARPGVLSGIGGFGALFRLSDAQYRNPVLVSTTDGVGTKLRIATAMNRHDTIGIDLVAMCVNDLIVQGAEPLFFLDYFATSRLDVEVAAEVLRGIARGCEIAGVALVGGETAEMPDIYAPGDYDLAGFAVGVVEAEGIIDGSLIQAGDAVLGLAASGIHSNGFSLVRRVLERSRTSLDNVFENRTFGAVLLEPTRIYVKIILGLIKRFPVRGIAHITGGGLIENLPRVLPAGLGARLDAGSWSRPPIFDWIQDQGGIGEQEMLRTFNCGIGMTVVLPAEHVEAALKHLRGQGETVWEIGVIEAREDGARPCIIAGA
jgi:phosphoribosylformylglycinamidine cyclo-ligase